MIEPHPTDHQPDAGARTISVLATVACRPWARHVLAQSDWAAMAEALPGQSLVLLGLWADTQQVHALFLDEATQAAVPVSTHVEGGFYPALSSVRPQAALFERMIRDLWGHAAETAPDMRPWLDHGAWPQSSPMAVRPGAVRPPHQPADPLQTDREPLMQLPLGPVWGRIEEAARLRLTLDGTVIIGAEAHLGFAHKGILALVRGKAPRTAARFAARLSADATVAHSVAFAAAIEAALDVVAPPRAVALRTVMLEIERIAGHLDNLAETGRLANALPVHTHCAFLRERLLRASATVFGHRLMMDCVTPGGVGIDIADGGPELILRALGDISSQILAIRRLHDGTALAARLTGVGRAEATLVSSLGVGGVVGRASGRRFDARALAGGGIASAPRGAPRHHGDAAARQHLRISEIEHSLRLISAALDGLPAGPLTVTLPAISGEGIACTESIRGDVWHWLRLDHGQIAGFFPRDPGWVLWPLAERVMRNNAAADVDLIRASLALPASAIDL
jgi:Ni,Fe-hydrogenase III large subunit